MAELATLARPYANAVFAVAKAESDLDRWSRMLAVLSAAATDERIRWLLSAPDVDDMTKAFRVTDVCGDELNDRARRVVQVLGRSKRLPLLPEMPCSCHSASRSLSSPRVLLPPIPEANISRWRTRRGLAKGTVGVTSFTLTLNPLKVVVGNEVTVTVK